ncbi:MAG: ABC transporter substrate-binding protein [Bacteroidetes bacterium]|nr:ABC transporter substrate-binding protein [Bacteroidota bacterium]MCL5026361.1 ABC transporter substrate-binding protein [Chloroflexota bacterium]
MSLDPHLATTRTHWALGALYDCLFELELADKVNIRWQVEPALAESWKQVDPTTVEFKVRPGVVFHDGSSLTADDVKFSLERIATNPKSYGKDFISAQSTVEKVDAQTVRAKLKAPNAAYVPNLSCWAYTMGIVSKAAVEKLGEEEFGRKSMGTGPFDLAEYMPDDHVTVKKFANYWQKGTDGQALPYLDGATFRVINDTSVMQLELKAGNLDVVGSVDPKDVAGVKANPELIFEESPGQATFYFTHGYNQQTGPFSNNLKLRQAAEYAIDRQSLATVMTSGAGRPAYYPYWAPGMLGYDETLPRYEFNLDKAKQLLKEAGYPDGVEINFMTIAREPDRRIVEVVQQMWAKAGIRAQVDSLERLAWISRIQNGNFQVAFWGTGTALDPDTQKFYVYTKASANWSNWSSKDMDQCMDQGATELDPSRRAEIYKRCQRIIYDEAYVGAGYLLPGAVAYRKSVNGVGWQFAANNLRRVWLEK